MKMNSYIFTFRGIKQTMDISKILENIYHLKNNNLKELYHSGKRINKMGDALEHYIKDACCNTYHLPTVEERIEAYERVFSYQGTISRPPDFILRGGDAFEIKKIQSETADIQLNSSYPKRTLKKDDPKLSKACRESEDWIQKDMWYTIGIVKNAQIKRLWFIDGSCIAADDTVYEEHFTKLSQSISHTFGQQAVKTKELGRFNRVDPLGSTHMRVRPMWIMKNPLHTFGHVVPNLNPNLFSCIAIMRKEKWSIHKKVEGMHVWEGVTMDPNCPEKEMEIILTYFTY